MKKEFEKAKKKVIGTEEDSAFSYGFNKGADWAYKWLNENIPTLKKGIKQSEDLAIALDALEKARVTIHCSTKSGKYCSLESIKPVNDALTKIRGEL